MATYRPYRSYINVLILSTVLALLIFILTKTNKSFGIIFAYALGLAYLIPAEVIVSPRIELTDDNVLIYKTRFYEKSVNLAKLTDCNYHFQLNGRGMPTMNLHLYDADGGSVTFPANWWGERKKLLEAIKLAVITHKLSVDARTSKKLGLDRSLKA